MTCTLRIVDSGRTHRLSRWANLVAFLPAVAAVVAGACAAGASYAADESSQTTLMEIVVTAQKREQNLQDVPISVIAISGQQLKDAGVTDIKNLTALTPGMTTTSTTSENVTTVRIRGIGTVGDNPGLGPPLGPRGRIAAILDAAGAGASPSQGEESVADRLAAFERRKAGDAANPGSAEPDKGAAAPDERPKTGPSSGPRF